MMNDPDFWQIWRTKALLYVLFSAIGGFLGYIMRALDARVHVHWGRAFAESFAAGFVGTLTFLLCNSMALSDQWTGVIVGVSGWLGANATIGILSKVVLKKLGVDEPREQPIYERRYDYDEIYEKRNLDSTDSFNRFPDRCNDERDTMGWQEDADGRNQYGSRYGRTFKRETFK